MTKTKNENKRYTVIRDGAFVSENQYSSRVDALEEYTYWEKLTKKWDPTSKVEILEH